MHRLRLIRFFLACSGAAIPVSIMGQPSVSLDDALPWKDLAYWAFGVIGLLISIIAWFVWDRVTGNTQGVRKFTEEAAVKFEESRKETAEDLEKIERQMEAGFNGIGTRIDVLQREMKIDFKELEANDRRIEGELHKTRSMGIQEHALFDKRITEHDYRLRHIESRVDDLRAQTKLVDRRSSGSEAAA